MSIGGDVVQERIFLLRGTYLDLSRLVQININQNIKGINRAKSVFHQAKLLYLIISQHTCLKYPSFGTLYYSAFINHFGHIEYKRVNGVKMENKQLIIYHSLSLPCLFLIDPKRLISPW